MDLHIEFRERRLRAGLSQADVAKRLGVSQAAIAMAESGTRPIPEQAIDTASIRLRPEVFEPAKQKAAS